MILGQYSDEVCEYVTSPLTGIQRKCKWPPSVAEIVEACDEHKSHLARVGRFATFGQRTAQERAALAPPAEQRPTREEMEAKYGKNWGLTSLDEKPKEAHRAPSWDEITAFYQANPSRMKALTSRKD